MDWSLVMLLKNWAIFNQSCLYIAKAVECEPENPDFLYMLGDIQLRINLLEKAEDSFRKVLAINPDHVEIYVDLSEVVAERTGIIDALEIVNAGIKYSPGNSLNHYRAAAYQLLLGTKKHWRWKHSNAHLFLTAKSVQEIFSYLPEIIQYPEFMELIEQYKPTDDK